MSKFCSNFGTLTYLELDILRKGLMLETESVHQEYLTKARHVNDCTASIGTNENQLIHIDNCMEMLKLNIASLEEELLLIECDLIECSKVVETIENSQNCSICRCLGIPPKTEREKFMDLLQKTSFHIWQLYDFSSHVEKIIKHFCVPKTTYDIIFRILNCHNVILCNTERNMDLVMDKLLAITNYLTWNKSFFRRPLGKRTLNS
ncbi:uncharacterized protein LOC105262031 isoform X2 [Musca domestica]|uniref:Uncharacterized protein LOC105262031 isoform X2 n=2 Tax=Musca domestica TaxID=7370 RepID=A0A9J7DA86_MUSDO|nr:uncharacterized protein LOC105262031 isoform X2 [Musca domestica]